MRAEARGSRGGFAVAAVVFLLFAIAVAGAAGYQVVRLEADMAVGNEEGVTALSVAVAGLERFVGESVGVPGDSVEYYIGDGTVLIRSRLLASVDSVTDLYLLRSEASVENDVYADSPARRTVSQLAYLHKDPVGIHAALMAPAGNVRVQNGATVSGYDDASPSECSVGGRWDVAGVANTGNVQDRRGGTVEGDPDDLRFGNYEAVYDSAKVRWDVLQDPNFNIEHDGSPPNFSSLPSDSFPVVRATEDLSAGFSWSGRGVLIVPGTFSTNFGFQWDGIILAGDLGNLNGIGSDVDGLVIGGLDGAVGRVQIRWMDIQYHSCNVFDAMASIAYLEPLEQTWLEEF